jgi:Protein of unknown function (DUF3667)
MAHDTTHPTDTRDEPIAPADRVVGSDDAPRHGPFTLAALLDLNDEELAQPISRVAPQEHRWEQLSFAVMPDTGEAVPAELRTSAATEPPIDIRELIPGLDVPGAVEVPVYLAGKTLHDFLRDADVVTSPVRPPAITIAAVGRPRKKQPAPIANFEKAAEVPVLWPKRSPDSATSVLPQECARCGAPSNGDSCQRCGHETAVPAQLSNTWSHFIAAFLDSDSRPLRTIGALILAPGELTRAYLSGHRRRYVAPIFVITAALLLFAIVSAIGGLRPRPDRTLMIGTDRTAEVMPGLAERTPVNSGVDAPPDFVHDVATTMDYVPLLWFPLMTLGVLALVSCVTAFQRREEAAEVVFTAHFVSWFVLWWGIAVPLLLLLTKFSFEYSAAWDGVGRVRYLADGQIDGLSPTWNALHAAVVSPAFHSGLVALGIAPWAVIAWHRVFETTWPRAGIAGLLVAAVPIALLSPFA